LSAGLFIKPWKKRRRSTRSRAWKILTSKQQKKKGPIGEKGRPGRNRVQPRKMKREILERKGRV